MARPPDRLHATAGHPAFGARLPESARRAPIPATPLLGREADVRELTRRIVRGDVRLLTLVGPPGVGKTRLALEVGRAVAESLADGIAFIDLAPLTDAGRVLDAIALTVGLREAPGTDLRERLAAFLRDREVLLILDNLEHLTDAAPDVGALLAACPDLRILDTSRAPLHLHAEHEFPVAPLALPGGTGLEAAAASPAVGLFVARAQAVRPDFALTAENAAAVASVCARLDGLPLAIELAAARVKVLDPEALAQHLYVGLDLLTSGPRDVPERHRTVRGAIAWSYDLLDDADRALFRRLGVFTGGCSLEAAFEVCADLGNSAAVLDGLARLVDRSLVRRDGPRSTARDPGPVDGPRFAMLQTVREFACERLAAAGEAKDAARRHGAWAVGLAERTAPHLQGPEQAAWLDRIEVEHDNLRAALRWALGAGGQGSGDPETGLRLAAALWWFWYVRGHFTEGRRWLERALEATARPVAARVRALAGASSFAALQGDAARAEALSREGLALARQAGDSDGAAYALLNLGGLALRQKDARGARALLEESLALFAEARDDWGRACALVTLEPIIRREGASDRATDMLEESVRILRAVGDRMCAASAVNGLARQARAAGDLRRAALLHREGLVYARDIWSRLGIAQGLEGLAATAAADDPAYAARLLGAAEAIRETLKVPVPKTVQEDRERTAAAARGLLSAGELQAAWAEGRAMSPERAVAYALEGPQAGRERSPGRLSPRERDVAALVAEGRSNREIAEALFITAKTVESHILHIMNKLNVRSRTQIGIWAAERGLRYASEVGPVPPG